MIQSCSPSMAVKRRNLHHRFPVNEGKRHKSNPSCHDHCSIHHDSQQFSNDHTETQSNLSQVFPAHTQTPSIASDNNMLETTSTPSTAATPYYSSSSFQQSPSLSSVYSHPQSQDLFGLLSNSWAKDDQSYVQCAESEPCTDPTCLDACPDVVPCHSEEECPISGDCFGVPCWDEECIGEFGSQDICCSEECPPETRCESPPCYNTDCHIPVCESFCPTAETSTCHVEDFDYQNVCDFPKYHDSSVIPPCGCIDPQCLLQSRESCEHPHDATLHHHVAHKHRTSTSDLNSMPAYNRYQNPGYASYANNVYHYQGSSYVPAGYSNSYDRALENILKEEPYSPQTIESKVQFGLGALNITPEDFLKGPPFHPTQSNVREETHKCQWCYTVTESNPSSVPMCGETFSTPEELHQHVEKIHLDRLPREDRLGNGFYCHWTGCDRYMCRSFQARPKLKRHVQTHTSYKPFTCSQCGIQMKTKDAMEKHERTHTGERPYECTVPGCGKEFATSTELKTHMTIHEGRKPHQCPICQECFADSSNLSKHKKTHYAGRYVCPDCGARMKRWDQMRRHIATQEHASELLHDRKAQQDYKARMDKEFSEMPDRHRILNIKDTP